MTTSVSKTEDMLREIGWSRERSVSIAEWERFYSERIALPMVESVRSVLRNMSGLILDPRRHGEPGGIAVRLSFDVADVRRSGSYEYCEQIARYGEFITYPVADLADDQVLAVDADGVLYWIGPHFMNVLGPELTSDVLAGLMFAYNAGRRVWTYDRAKAID